MRKLILIRHSLPMLVPDCPPSQWELTPEGRNLCFLLADRLVDCKPGVVVTSQERKAEETGTILAERLGIPWNAQDNLHEHRRQGGVFLDQETFLAQIAKLFQYPDQLVFGLETAQQALDRYHRAIFSVMSKQSENIVAIVSHGTVMALYYGKITGCDPYLFWGRLGLPSFYTVSWPDQVLLSAVMDVTTSE